MLDKDDIVFVEVKYRRYSLEAAIESVTEHKQRRIIKAANYFLHSHPQYQLRNCRFDVVAVSTNNKKFVYRWIKNAFGI